MKILVAEDDLDQLTLRCMLLERSGFETLQAADIATALSLAQAEKPECAVVDLYFPTPECGFRLVRDLKAINFAMRIVLLTGATRACFTGQLESGLIDEMIEKGSGSANLLRKLNSLKQNYP